MRVRFMSYNIQHGVDYAKQVIDLDLMADTIRALGADFCGLNEVRNVGADSDYTDQAAIIGKRLGWHYYFGEALKFNGKNPYGNAFVSRFPILSVQTIGIPDPPVKDEDAYYETRCLIKAVIDIGGEPVTVFVVHFGLPKSERRNAVATVCEQVKKTSGKMVFMGDLNSQPGDPILLPLYDVLQDTGVFLEPGTCSWDSKNPSQKIDYIFTSGIKQLCANIPQIVTSDHCPYLADLEV